MKAEYIDHMGTDLTVVNAARVSFAKESDWDNESLRIDDKGLIAYLARHNHWTPFSHAMITMREKVPIFVARQRFKHKVGFTENEVSRRYVDDEPEFFNPVFRLRPPDRIKQGSGDNAPEEVQEQMWYEFNRVQEAAENAYRNALDLGIAPEQARMILPQSMYTEYYVTGSLAAWARAYKLRIDGHAQKEIQQLAEQWDKIIRPLFPVSWPTLVSGTDALDK